MAETPLTREPQSIGELLNYLAANPWLNCTRGGARDRGLRLFLGCDARGWLVLRRATDGTTQRLRLLSSQNGGLETGLAFHEGGFTIERGIRSTRYWYVGPPAGQEDEA